jgi:hypothetical protein
MCVSLVDNIRLIGRVVLFSRFRLGRTILSSIVCGLLFACCPRPVYAQFAWHELNTIGRIDVVNGQFCFYGSEISVTADGFQICDLPITGKALAYGNGKYVAVSGNSSLGQSFNSSTNGITWTNVYAPVAAMSRIAFGNDRYVATGNNGALASSVDGKKWITHSVTSSNLNDIIFANGRFVSVGEGTVLVSENGTNWLVANSPANYQLRFLTWGNGIYVAGGTNVILSSTNGLDWIARKETTNALFQSLCWDGKVFLAAGQSDSVDLIYRSQDGINWDDVSPAPSFVLSIAYANGTYLAAAQERHPGTGNVTSVGPFNLWISKNGRDWTNFYQPIGPAPFASVGYGPSGWVAGDRTGSLFYSTNGTFWNRAAQKTSSLNRDIQYGLGYYIVPGPAGYFYLSTNAVDWFRAPGRPLNASDARRIATGNGLVAAVFDSANQVAVTPDLVTWTNISLPIASPYAITFAQGKFVIGGQRSFMTSSNGVDWGEAVKLTNFFSPFDLHGCDAGFVAVDGGGQIAFSVDARQWTVTTAPKRTPLRNVTYGNGTWVAVGDNGSIATSLDGLTWNLLESGSFDELYEAVGFGGGLFVAVHYSGGGISISSPPILSFTTPAGSLSLNIPAAMGDCDLVSSEDLIHWSSEIRYPAGTLNRSILLDQKSPQKIYKIGASP